MHSRMEFQSFGHSLPQVTFAMAHEIVAESSTDQVLAIVASQRNDIK